jgi:hypothetical protein
MTIDIILFPSERKQTQLLKKQRGDSKEKQRNSSPKASNNDVRTIQRVPSSSSRTIQMVPKASFSRTIHTACPETCTPPPELSRECPTP